MSRINLKHLRNVLTITLSVLIIAVAAYAVYLFINKSAANQEQSQSESAEQLPQPQASDTIVFEGDTEYGYEICYDNNVCVVKSAAELAEESHD